MIRLLLFQFENTLVDSGGRVFPHVTDALKTMKNFETGTGNTLGMWLVSLSVPQAIGAGEALDQLISRLEAAGLRSFFEPVSQRVAILGQADTRTLEICISRAGGGMTTDECLFFTEDRNAAGVAESLGMRALFFDNSGRAPADFTDWSEAGLLVANLVDTHNPKNREAALRLYLAAHANVDLISLVGTRDSDTLLARVKTWHPIRSDKLGDLSGVNVKLPAQVTVHLDAAGKVKTLDCTQPSPEDEEEARHFLESLVTHGQIAADSELPARGATHQINTDAAGRRYLIRKRFTAV